MCIFVLFSFRQTKHHSPKFIFYNTKPQGNKQGKGSYITCANYHVHLFVLISFKQKKLSPNFIFTTLSLKGKNKEKEVTSHVKEKFGVLQKKVLSFGPNRTVEVRPNSSAEPNVRSVTR